MNKKIAMSGMSILASLAIMGGATFAFFSDTGTSTGNIFATGTLDLKLSDSVVNGGLAQTDQDTVASSFGSNTLVPGSCTGPQTLTLKNTGTVAADHAEVTVDNTATDAGNNATPDMDAYLRINSLTYDTGNALGQILDQVGDSNAFVDLADWEAGTGLDNLALANLNIGHNLVMDVCLDSSAPNDIQGDSVLSLFTITLNQDSTQ